MQADGIGGKPRCLMEGPGANGDLPLDPGLGKSLGFTLAAADQRKGICCARLTTIQSLLVLPTSDRIGRPQAGVLFLNSAPVTQMMIPLLVSPNCPAIML